MDKFLADSNTFISAHRTFYASDLIPAYWNRLSDHIDKKEIVLLDMVKMELEKGNDNLPDWIADQGFDICIHKTPKIIENYCEVINYIDSCGYYNKKGLNSWAQNDIMADSSGYGAWLYYSDV